MSAERPSPGGGARLLHADLDGVLSASRNFSALASRLPTLQTRAIGTLRRRLPVQARRDIQAEYQVGARRLTQDLQARPTEDGLRLVGRFPGIGLRNFAARQTRRGVTAAVLRGKRSLREHAFLGVGVNRKAQVFRREGAKREMRQGRYAVRLMGDASSTLTAPAALPLSLRPMQERVLTLTVGLDGPPVIDAAAVPSFADGATWTIRIDGLRLNAWSLPPDWTAPVIGNDSLRTAGRPADCTAVPADARGARDARPDAQPRHDRSRACRERADRRCWLI